MANTRETTTADVLKLRPREHEIFFGGDEGKKGWADVIHHNEFAIAAAAHAAGARVSFNYRKHDSSGDGEFRGVRNVNFAKGRAG